jgi:hypothetical protein
MKDYGVAIVQNPLYPAKTYVRVYLDKENKIAHFLDMDDPDSTSLTNAMDKTLVQEIGKEIKQDLSGFETWLYGTDGVIAVYKDTAFHNLPDNQLLMPTEFLIEMKNRRGNH